MKKFFLLFVMVMLSTTAFGQPYIVGILVHGGDPDITEIVSIQSPVTFDVTGISNVNAVTECSRGEYDFFTGYMWGPVGSLEDSFEIEDATEALTSFRLSIGQSNQTAFAAVVYQSR